MSPHHTLPAEIVRRLPREDFQPRVGQNASSRRLSRDRKTPHDFCGQGHIL